MSEIVTTYLLNDLEQPERYTEDLKFFLSKYNKKIKDFLELLS